MANPTWFVAKDYLANKLAQLIATDPKSNWTAESLTKALEGAGYKGDEGAFKHFNDFGMNENVSPNAAFDANVYLVAKANQMNALNIEGKTWTPATVMDAIKAAGMNSAWEHYDKFGSNEGVAASATFDTAKYFEAKTALMNTTAEGGRANWTIAEVKAAFAENGLNALEHYNLFGKAEFEGKTPSVDFLADNGLKAETAFDPFTGAQKYLLKDALAAATLPSKYILTDSNTNTVDAGTIKVAQFNGMKDFIAAAVNGADYAKATVTYGLDDTVAAIDGASASAIAGSQTGVAKGSYNITDTLANVATGNDDLVNGATVANAKVVFGVNEANVPAAKPADVVTSTVTYADIKGNVGASAEITIVHADKADAAGIFANKGNAVVAVDGSGTTAVTLDLTKVFTTTVDAQHLTFNVTGSDKVDTITAHTNGGVITGGKGADVITLGAGIDKIAYTSSTAADLLAEAGSVLGVSDTVRPVITTVDTATGTSAFAPATDKIVFTKAAFNALTGADGTVTAENMVFVNAADSGTKLDADTAHGARFYFDAANATLYFDAKGDSTLTAAATPAATGMADDFAVITLTGTTVDASTLLGMIELA